MYPSPVLCVLNKTRVYKPPLWAAMGISGYLGCITTRGNEALLYFPRKIWYDGYMTNEEIASLLDKESYRIWDTTKVIKNQDYHDGLVKGLKMAAKFVRNQG